MGKKNTVNDLPVVNEAEDPYLSEYPALQNVRSIGK